MKLLIGLFTIMGSALLVESHTPFHNDSEWHEEVKREEAEEVREYKRETWRHGGRHLGKRVLHG